MVGAQRRVRHIRVLLFIIFVVFLLLFLFKPFILSLSLLFDIFLCALSASGWQLVCRPFGWQVPVVWFPVLKPSPFSLQQKNLCVDFIIVFFSLSFGGERSRGTIFIIFLIPFCVRLDCWLLFPLNDSHAAVGSTTSRRSNAADARRKRTKEPIDTKRLIDFSRDRIHLTRAQLFLFFTLFSHVGCPVFLFFFLSSFWFVIFQLGHSGNLLNAIIYLFFLLLLLFFLDNIKQCGFDSSCHGFL